MRYRGGGRIGGFDDDVPQKSSAVGCWKLGEACQWLHVDRWPRRKIIITDMPEFVDTTLGGYGEIEPNIYSEYGYGVIEWQYSNDSGSTWTTIPANAKHTVDQDYGYLYLSGQTRNTGSSAAYPVTTPPPIERASANGGFPDDGRVYRVVVTAGLRRVSSDYYDTAEQKWKGRCTVRNDRVVISFFQGPCANPDTNACTGPQPTATVRVGNELEVFAQARAVGEEHGEVYEVKYSWRTSPNGVNNWVILPATGDSGADTNTLKFINLTSGVAYLQAIATFTYSDPANGHVVPLTERPLVNGYSDVMAITVTPVQ